MPSSWIATYETSANGRFAGQKRYRVKYRLGGAESKHQYAGSFGRQADAIARKRWVDGELAACRVPDLAVLETGPILAPTLTEIANQWKASRVDVTESTRVLHRVALDRVLPILGHRPIDTITADDVNEMVVALSAKGKKRETIRKSVKYLAAVLDFHGVDPNPARDKQRIRLPHEEQHEIVPPLASHVEAVYGLLASAYRLPLLWLDWSGARVASIDLLTVGDFDERGQRVRLRATTTKTRQALWVDLPDELSNALVLSLPPGRTGTSRRPSSPARPPTDSAPRSPVRAGRPLCRFSARTTSGTVGYRSCTHRGAHGRRSGGSWASASCR